MKSNLTKTEFKQRLAELTSKEKALFNFSRRPFRGTFDGSTFDLTRNSFWPHVKTIRIKGEYIKIGYDATEVIYEIGVSKSFQFLALLFLGSTFVGVNLILIASQAKVSAIFTFSGFWIFVALWYKGLSWISTKIITQRFQTEFEIETETSVRARL